MRLGERVQVRVEDVAAHEDPASGEVGLDRDGRLEGVDRRSSRASGDRPGPRRSSPPRTSLTAVTPSATTIVSKPAAVSALRRNVRIDSSSSRTRARGRRCRVAGAVRVRPPRRRPGDGRRAGPAGDAASPGAPDRTRPTRPARSTGRSMTNRAPRPPGAGSNRRRPSWRRTMSNETGQPQARALAGRLGREEGDEQLRPIRRRHARPVVGDGDPDRRPAPRRPGSAPGGDLEPARRSVGQDRLDGVRGQVDQDLLDLRPVDGHPRQARLDVDDPLDTALLRVRLELADGLEQRPERGRVALRRSRPDEVEERPDDLARPLRLVDEQRRRSRAGRPTGPGRGR